MNRYKLTFQQGRKRLSQVVEARNYEDAEQIAKKVAKVYKGKTGERIELRAVERVYKVDTHTVKKATKHKYGVTDAIGNALDFFA